MLESLPRILLLEQAGFSREKCDRALAPDLGSLTARQLRNTLDISEAKIFRLSSLGSIQCEELIVTSFPGIRRNVSGRQVASIRELVGNYRGRGQRRIYVSRGQGVRRSILNEAELVRILASHEFEVFTPGNGIQDFRVFSEASVIVGSHGAGLANIAACHPGTSVLEIVPCGFEYPYFYTLADSAGCFYAAIEGEPGQDDARNESFRVDIDRFRRMLTRVLNATT